MITLADYWQGRDVTHALLLSVDMRIEAARTVDLANRLIVMATVHGVIMDPMPGTESIVPSGWRPPDINAATPGAKVRSLHLCCRAIDMYDPDGDLDEWLLSDNGQRVLADLGLWHEHPACTKGWAHVQTQPPASKRRTFYP